MVEGDDCGNEGGSPSELEGEALVNAIGQAGVEGNEGGDGDGEAASAGELRLANRLQRRRLRRCSRARLQRSPGAVSCRRSSTRPKASRPRPQADRASKTQTRRGPAGRSILRRCIYDPPHSRQLPNQLQSRCQSGLLLRRRRPLTTTTASWNEAVDAGLHGCTTANFNRIKLHPTG